MELKLINEQGQEAAKLEASDVLFGREFNEALVHQIVVAYQANARSGDSKQKDRSEVRHTTTKPWRQKGTGRARSGSNGSPLATSSSAVIHRCAETSTCSSSVQLAFDGSNSGPLSLGAEAVISCNFGETEEKTDDDSAREDTNAVL